MAGCTLCLLPRVSCRASSSAREPGATGGDSPARGNGLVRSQPLFFQGSPRLFVPGGGLCAGVATGPSTARPLPDRLHIPEQAR